MMEGVTFERLREMLMTNCMLQVSPEEIEEETPLFGPEGLGLDSIDALQMTVAVEKEYGVAISNATTAREALQSLSTLRDHILRQHPASEPS